MILRSTESRHHRVTHSTRKASGGQAESDSCWLELRFYLLTARWPLHEFSVHDLRCWRAAGGYLGKPHIEHKKHLIRGEGWNDPIGWIMCATPQQGAHSTQQGNHVVESMAVTMAHRTAHVKAWSSKEAATVGRTTSEIQSSVFQIPVPGSFL